MKLAKDLRDYASYAVFCVLTLGGVLYSGVQLLRQDLAATEAERAVRHAEFYLENAQDAKAGRVANTAPPTPDQLQAFTEQKQQAEQHYAQLTHQNKVHALGWCILMAAWLVLICGYVKNSPLFNTICAIFAFLFYGIVYFFFAAFGHAIWAWLNTPWAGYAQAWWLVGGISLTVSAAAIYYDFFRSTPVTDPK